jgi:hypothetical protein
MGYLIGVCLAMLVANVAAARWAKATTTRALLWLSMGSPVFLWLALLLTSRNGGPADLVFAVGWSFAFLIPAIVGAGVISLLGQFFGRLSKVISSEASTFAFHPERTIELNVRFRPIADLSSLY